MSLKGISISKMGVPHQKTMETMKPPISLFSISGLVLCRKENIIASGLAPARLKSGENHKVASSTRLCFDGDYYRLGAYVPLPLESESINYKEVIKNW
jgi:hypothetical protein